ncbi:MAG: pentapeptide repeat-containing protein [Halothece sp.]
MINLERYIPNAIVALILGLILLFAGYSTPAFAAKATLERTPLTLELLAERLENPIQQEGVTLIDLRQLEIDLTPENGEIANQFYQALQGVINRSRRPLGIDLSRSLIKGQLEITQLGLQTPLVGEALPPLLSPAEQERLQQDPRFETFLEEEKEFIQIPYITLFRGALFLDDTIFTDVIDFSNTFFLQRFEAVRATFEQEINFDQSSFSRTANFSGATFKGDGSFSNTSFFDTVDFTQIEFDGIANFTNAIFESKVSYEKAEFNKVANWMRSQFKETVNFSQAIWRDRALFTQSRFLKSLSFTNATFEKAAVFRQDRFNEVVDFEGVNLLEKIDFSNAVFANSAYLNVAGLGFDSDQATILGETGRIGKVIELASYEGNESVLRNLVLNFRNLEQIPDANEIDYKKQKLRFQQLQNCIVGTPFNRLFTLSRLQDYLLWLGLSLLLLLSDYGTNFGLVMSIGVVAIAYFGVLFWFVDRWRRRIPKPILPTQNEAIGVISSFTFLTFTSILGIFQTSDQPWLTLVCLGFLLIPFPLSLVIYLYKKGRYHNLLDQTYFLEDAGMRQLRLLIVRLPIVPRFGFFRERYLPILWDRRWNWLNYFDFSLNNWLKLGFNDIRLRDEHLPGIISTLVWYQWSLGILYVALLLWTLSRTIPGLNLLIYLK